MNSKKSDNKDEVTYVKWGILYFVIVMIIAGSVFYDDVYNDGQLTTIGAKFERWFGKK